MSLQLWNDFIIKLQTNIVHRQDPDVLVEKALKTECQISIHGYPTKFTIKKNC